LGLNLVRGKGARIFIDPPKAICVLYIDQGRCSEVEERPKELMEREGDKVGSDHNEIVLLTFLLTQIYQENEDTSKARDHAWAIIEPMRSVNFKDGFGTVSKVVLVCRYVDILNKLGLCKEAESALRQISLQYKAYNIQNQQGIPDKILTYIDTLMAQQLITRFFKNTNDTTAIEETEKLVHSMGERSKRSHNPSDHFAWKALCAVISLHKDFGVKL
jgi:hypothetical protein